jgi:hypothetical protein
MVTIGLACKRSLVSTLNDSSTVHDILSIGQL